jgi:hypothetical protein
LPHEAFTLQKLATPVRAAQFSRNFLAQSSSIGGLCALFIQLLIDSFLLLEIVIFPFVRL